MNDTIFAPKYTLNEEVKALLNIVERESWLTERVLLMPKHEAWFSRDVRVRRASGTTRIEGATLDEEQVRRLSGKSGTAPSKDERENLNALEAYGLIDYLSDQTDVPIDELVIRQLNRQFMLGESEALTPGVYRKGQNAVGSYTPPNQGDVPALMRSFALWLRSDDDVHPVLRAGIAHIHLVAIHPFWDGNGRTARGLSTLMLQRSVYGFRKLLSIEGTMLNFKDEYFASIENTLGAALEPDYDMTSWLEFFSTVVRNEADVLRMKLTEWHQHIQLGREIMEEVDAPTRLADGLAYAARNGSITRREYIEITGVSPITASRDLARLVELRQLVPEGKTRSRIYRSTLGTIRAESEPAEEQPPLLE